MSQRPSLSVVICTYNRAASLAETLDSVNACDLPTGCDVELVLIDNNSNDDTAAVCDRFAPGARMPFRRVLETAQGLSFARNRGIREAKGDVIIFTDDDVLVNATWLTAYATEFGEFGAECAFGRVHPEWRGTRPDWFHNWLRPAYALLDYGDERFVVTTTQHEFFGANFAVRRQLLVDMGGFDVKLGRTKGKLFIGEETRVFLELIRRNARIVYNPAIEVHHVIEERRKEKAYMFRYYHDTAESLVYAALQAPARRRVFGIPASRLSEIVAFHLRFLPTTARLALRGDKGGVFAMRLQRRRYSRMLFLFMREALRGTTTASDTMA